MSAEIEVTPSHEEIDFSHLPVLPLRDVVVYPHMVIPLFVGRQKSIKALEAAMLENKKIVLVAQRKSIDDDPNAEGLFTVGTISSLLQLL
ncbi:MAG TPA: LON peptidase substrate-binding domain-containing protein, partial [Legionellaceae bacterium]|nr:LON peptidase substrate-binding domain-containing protein [Legionellaceae bacterium]